MQTKTIIYAVGAFAAAGAVVLLGRKSGALFNGDGERMGGVRALYGTSAGQQQGVQAAVSAQWAELEQSVFRTQPDFWV